MGYKVGNFKYGLINSLEAESIPAGSFSNVLNFLTDGDKIELIRGKIILGDEQSGTGRIIGLHIAYDTTGTSVVFAVYNTGLLKYYNSSAGTWDAVNDLSGDPIQLTADQEVSFDNYESLAGNFAYLNSPKDGFYKIVVANPDVAIAHYDVAVNFKGYISIKDNACFLWGREKDKTGQYRSYVDVANYTTVTAEAIGALGSITYTGTLGFKAGGTRRTCFAITFAEVGGESFTDNFDGTLTGDAGGTGTINYATGVYSVTFNAITTGAVTSTYQWEDSNNNGITDFTYSSPRVAGESNRLRQDAGGDAIQGLGSFDESEYSFKKRSIYRVKYSDDDTTATNRQYRKNIGIPNWRAYTETGEGVYFVDEMQNGEKQIRLLRLEQGSTKVIPPSISQNLDLSNYEFDKADVIEFENFILIACRLSSSTENNRVIIYNKLWNSFDIVKWNIAFFTINDGVLIGGDSISNNVYTLFSGTDDDNFPYNASVEMNNDSLGIAKLKRFKRLQVEGNIGVDQNIKVYASYDDSSFIHIGTISGQGDYIDKSQATYIGANTIGKEEIGGGSSNNILGYHYLTEFKIRTPKFLKIKIKFTTEDIGYASISSYDFQRILAFREMLPRKYQ